MIDLEGLLKSTGAFRTIKGDIRSNRLSHAYLIVTADGAMLKEYLKIIARLIQCKQGDPCGECRVCNLIEQENFADVFFYPNNDDAVKTEDIASLIEESYVKPLESDKKLFIISHAETMNLSAQNKLLKTLEEPPKNVHIILGATSDFSLLPTVKSRVKRLEIPPFNFEQLFNALKDDCVNENRLKNALNCGDGTVGKALALYDDENFKELEDLAIDVLVNMKSSKDVAFFTARISESKADISDFFSMLELMLRDMLLFSEGKSELVSNKDALERLKKAENFSSASILSALERITEANKRKKFNANATMLIEWLLFQILEGKYKWQKL